MRVKYTLSHRTPLPASVIATLLILNFNADLQLTHKGTTYWLNIRLSAWVSQSDSPMRRKQLTSLNRSVIIICCLYKANICLCNWFVESTFCLACIPFCRLIGKSVLKCYWRMSTLRMCHFIMLCNFSLARCVHTIEMFQLESCVWGNHIYKEVWNTTFEEKLTCCRDSKNTEGPFAVAVKRRTTIVSHASRIMSAVCALFLAEQKIIISCTVSGPPVLVVSQLIIGANYAHMWCPNGT
jgi:hypothetical protein